MKYIPYWNTRCICIIYAYNCTMRIYREMWSSFNLIITNGMSYCLKCDASGDVGMQCIHTYLSFMFFLFVKTCVVPKKFET